MKNILTASLLFAATALGLSACGPVVPASPTWDHDIRPLMVARCIRCHGDPARIDPESAKLGKANAKLAILGTAAVAPVLSYAHFSDVMASGTLEIIKMSGKAVKGTLTGFPIMPPPPAETLEEWEIQLLDNWIANPK